MADYRPSGRVDASPLLCEECKRPWDDVGERWRIYLTDDEPATAVAYCPRCAQREFDQEEAPPQ